MIVRVEIVLGMRGSDDAVASCCVVVVMMMMIVIMVMLLLVMMIWTIRTIRKRRIWNWFVGDMIPANPKVLKS